MSVGESVTDHVSEITDTANENSNAPENEAPSWMWDENTPGTGDRPDFLPEKFKTVADAAKSYVHLEKKLGSAPNEYSFEAAGNWIDPNHEAFKEAAELAKSKHVPQEVFDKLLGATNQYLTEQTGVDTDEVAKLGENAEERLSTLDLWMKNNFSDKVYKAFTDIVDTAETVTALEEVRNMMLGNNQQIPNSNEASESTLSMEEIQDELTENLDKYKNDSKYRKEIQDKINQVAGKTGFVDK